MTVHAVSDESWEVRGMGTRLIQLYQIIPRSTAIQSSQSLPSTTTFPFLLVVIRTPLSCES